MGDCLMYARRNVRMNRGRVRDGASSPAVTPLTIFGSSVELWLRADLGVTIGTGVSAWADQSGKGRHCTQATGSRQPTVVSSWKNGKPALDFDPAALQVLANASGAILANGAAYSLFVVGAKDQDPDAVAYNDQLFRVVATAFHKHQVMFTGGVKYVAGSNAVDVSLTGAFGCGVNPFYASWVEPGNTDATVVAFRMNGTAKTTATQLNDLSAVTGYQVGGISAAYLDGKVAEVVLVSGVASAAQVAAMGAYHVAFWGAF
jgi:hypothetical protein